MTIESLASFSDVRLQAIAGLRDLCRSADGASSVEVARYLADIHGLNIHWKTIEAALSLDSSQVRRRKRQNRWYYTPTATGLRLIEVASETPHPLSAPPAAASARLSATKPKTGGTAKARIFIGSSTEGLDIAEAVQLNLDFEAECVIWHQGVFGLSEGTLEALCKAAPTFDFAILVLTPDDVALVRGEEKNTARDNVLLELGLLLGVLGRRRTFIVHPREAGMSLPSDLAGVTPATFARHADGNLRASLGATCTMIKEAMRKEGNRERKG